MKSHWLRHPSSFVGETSPFHQQLCPEGLFRTSCCNSLLQLLGARAVQSLPIFAAVLLLGSLMILNESQNASPKG